ncbi:MAG: carbonic anhydrase, partial [Planctomycetes bacterium]|nr:carbonic anhydrase [Planctomycetota bacterium]
MQKLVEGIHQFQNDVFSSKQELFERLARGQHPLALFVTCSDSRIDPSLLTQTEPGELFIMGNAGNIIPPYGASTSGEAGTIEFAVCALKITDIVICGHSQCEAMRGLLYPNTIRELPAVRSWLSHAEATRRIIDENYGHIQEQEARLTAVVEENVLVQLEHLCTHLSVAAALARNELHLHGWVYKIQTGEVFAYDVTARQFLPLADQAGVEV